MEREEIYKELQMTYDELQQYLIGKYGGAVCDYFATPECKSKSKKISRTKEGLYCHHMDEDKGSNLSEHAGAVNQPYEWQKKDRLVYCNVLEHLILHIKIAVLRQKDVFEKPRDVMRFFTTGGIFMLCEELNDMYINRENLIEWKRRCYEEVKENYKDYRTILQAVLSYIDVNYVGDKNKDPFLVPGTMVHFSDGDCEIVKVTTKRHLFQLRLPSGEENTYRTDIVADQLNYTDYIHKVAGNMASGYNIFYVRIFEDILENKECEEVVIGYRNLFKVDFIGHGFAKYAGIKLEDRFGSKNADMYLSKGLPMHCEINYDLTGKDAVFWKGARIPAKAKNNFYVIRIETMFDVKDGCEPFVRYREQDLMRVPFLQGTDNHHNSITKGWTILSTSDVYDRATNKYYNQYYDDNHKVVDAKVILTLGKEDYELFQENYNIRYLKVLDGCYFV